mmetsp:Transcript_48702/g.146766  ORF Transcript_48702/g.146766 Transcript_48702/m.146766 type:complete len:252 (-) Transcript_48702:443-1198(-)
MLSGRGVAVAFGTICICHFRAVTVFSFHDLRTPRLQNYMVANGRGLVDVVFRVVCIVHVRVVALFGFHDLHRLCLRTNIAACGRGLAPVTFGDFCTCLLRAVTLFSSNDLPRLRLRSDIVTRAWGLLAIDIDAICICFVCAVALFGSNHIHLLWLSRDLGCGLCLILIAVGAVCIRHFLFVFDDRCRLRITSNVLICIRLLPAVAPFRFDDLRRLRLGGDTVAGSWGLSPVTFATFCIHLLRVVALFGSVD